MAIINKPDMTNLWASGGAIIAPSASKVQTGWTAEIPPHQWENWVQNRQDLALGYLFQRGLAEWDSTTEYYANQSVVLHEGTVYIANTNNVGEEPSDVSSDWRTLFSDIPVASESQKGVVEIATTAEAQAMTNDSKALTPAKLAAAFGGANQGLAISGYQKLPGGLIIQWGNNSSAASNPSSVTFPIAFPTSCCNVNIGSYQGSANVQSYGVLNGFSTTGFTWSGFLAYSGEVPTGVSAVGQVEIYWIAIGH